MHKLSTDEIVWTTFFTVKRIREYRNWWDMLLLYFAYMEQSRIQQTNKSFSLDVFMVKKMGRWKDRFRKAKRNIKELWLIDTIQSRKNWKISAWYVRANFLINEDKVIKHVIDYEVNNLPVETSRTPENKNLGLPESGKQETNAWSNKDKCLKNINKTIEASVKWEYLVELNKIFTRWNGWTFKNKSIKGLKQCRKITKDIEDEYIKIRKHYDNEEINIWLSNYIKDIKNRAIWEKWWYWEHRFSLYEFIKQKNWLKLYINK